MMATSKNWVNYLPILKTLSICPSASRRHARTELLWTVGFAFVAFPIVFIITILTRPFQEIPAQMFDVASRGELMIYATTVCGTALYSLRHGFDGPIPDALKQRVTQPGTLTVWTSIILSIALIAYVVRRTGDINNFPVNENLLNAVSVLTLIASLTFAYVVLSLKFALRSGASDATQEQTEDFVKAWEAERGA